MAKAFFDPTVDETEALMNAGMTEIHYLEVGNVDNADYFLQLWDAGDVADVIPGTTAPDAVFQVPARDSATKRGLLKIFFGDEDCLKFQKGVIYAVTTTYNGNSGPATDCFFAATYRDVRR